MPSGCGVGDSYSFRPWGTKAGAYCCEPTNCKTGFSTTWTSEHGTTRGSEEGQVIWQMSSAEKVELSGGNSNDAKNLQACIGECDNDGQCASGLKCFQREAGENIPGCKGLGGDGDGGKDWDYCYDPSVFTEDLCIEKCRQVKATNYNYKIDSPGCRCYSQIQTNGIALTGTGWKFCKIPKDSGVFKRATVNRLHSTVAGTLETDFVCKDSIFKSMNCNLECCKKFCIDDDTCTDITWYSDNGCRLSYTGCKEYEDSNTLHILHFKKQAIEQLLNSNMVRIAVGGPGHNSPCASTGCIYNKIFCEPKLSSSTISIITDTKRCWARMPTGCNRDLGETSGTDESKRSNRDTGWFVVPVVGISTCGYDGSYGHCGYHCYKIKGVYDCGRCGHGLASCNLKRTAEITNKCITGTGVSDFNTHCTRSDAMKYWGMQPPGTTLDQCSIHKDKAEEYCRLWNECGGVVCSKSYGKYCVARQQMDDISSQSLPNNNYPTTSLLDCSELRALGWSGKGEISLEYTYSDDTKSIVSLYCSEGKTYLTLVAGKSKNYQTRGCKNFVHGGNKSSKWEIAWSRIKINVHDMTIDTRDGKFATITNTPTACTKPEELSYFTTDNLAGKVRFLGVDGCGCRHGSKFTSKADLSGTSFTFPETYIGNNRAHKMGYEPIMTVTPSNLAGRIITVELDGCCGFSKLTDGKKNSNKVKIQLASRISCPRGTFV